MSEFWKAQLAPFKKKYSRAGKLSDRALEDLVAAAGYGFEGLPEEAPGVAEDPSYRRAIETLRSIQEHLRLRKAIVAGVDKVTWEHSRAIAFLEHEGLLEEYLQFIEPLRVRSTMSSARHWYYARTIADLLDSRSVEKADLLEIGAGAGNLAFFLTVLGRVRSYTIVDLPEMLVHSSFTLASRLPDAELRFVTSTEEAGDPPGEGRYAFITPEAAPGLPNASADVALNINSFMEMDRDVRDGYFDVVYRVCRPGALFLNINRRQEVLPLSSGETWDNNPLLYPYRSDDDVLRWEEEPFQTFTRSDFNFSTSLAMIRVSAVA
jgi:hypothetical protein